MKHSGKLSKTCSLWKKTVFEKKFNTLFSLKICHKTCKHTDHRKEVYGMLPSDRMGGNYHDVLLPVVN